MSDFIARIAARAVGTPPVARPRLPASFGEAAISEVADERVVAPPERSERPRSEVQTTVRQEAPAVEPPTVVTVTERVEAAPPSKTLVRETMRSVERTVHERELSAPVPALPQEPDVVVQPAAAVAVRATPVVLEAAVQAAAVPAPAARIDESPPVRVHIGRLEVRANLQQAPLQQQPPRREPRAQGLTLADYLRGKREAG